MRFDPPVVAEIHKILNDDGPSKESSSNPHEDTPDTPVLFPLPSNASEVNPVPPAADTTEDANEDLTEKHTYEEAVKPGDASDLLENNQANTDAALQKENSDFKKASADVEDDGASEASEEKKPVNDDSEVVLKTEDPLQTSQNNNGRHK